MIKRTRRISGQVLTLRRRRKLSLNLLSHKRRLQFEALDSRQLLAGDLFDFGDAPAPYPTSIAPTSGPVGAFHEAFGPQFGALRDVEEDAIVNADATGDDTDNLADEDGVDFGVFRMGQENTVTVDVRNVGEFGAYVDAWLDFEGDGDWLDPQDQIIFSYFVETDGVYDILTPPGFGVIGDTYARVRVSEFGSSSADGYASSGEVEDYKVDLRPPVFDFGDAPAPYPTSIAPTSGPVGAFHEAFGPQFGALRDVEEDAIVNADATGDDTDNLADEDGVDFGVFRMGQENTVTVDVRNVGEFGAYVDAWLDFEGDGDWLDPQDQIIFSYFVETDGVYDILTPPGFGVIGDTYARVRVSEFGSSSADGYASSGEVEDYKVDLRPPVFDFGDAPAPYPTSIAPTSGPVGAFHEAFGPQFGALRDVEEDAIVNADATGDDTDNLADEDGVDFGVFRMGQENTVTVDVRNVGEFGAYVDAWLDFEGDGDWLDPQDQIIFSYFVETDGVYDILTPPGFGVIGDTYARVRVSEFGSSSADGYASSGEVEDYKVDLRPPVFDFGDAPAPYPTSIAPTSGPVGAFHEAFGPQFGALRDVEEDAIVNADATGDDTDNLADEDGVDFGVFRMGQENTVTVDVRNVGEFGAYVDAWLDFEGDGDWLDPQDQIIFSYFVETDGVYDILTPPGFGVIGDTYARVRVSEFGSSSADGYASSGEVEDYKVDLRPPVFDFGDAPAPYPTSIAPTSGPVGAFHEAFGPQFGALRDVEEDAIVNADATGDDTDNLADEDGVDFGVFRMGQENTVTVDVRNVGEFGAYVDAWLDFEGDGDWLDPQDQIIFSYFVETDGVYDILTPPGFGVIGDTYARVRVSEFGSSSADGYASSGEVEDYKVDLRPPVFDFGDAPAPYPTSIAPTSGPVGAFHEAFGPQFGALRDVEEDAIVNADATGDDTDNLADEDGVDFGVFRMGQENTVTVDVRNVGEFGAYVDAWLDFEGDGDWLDPQDQIIFSYFVETDGVYDILTPPGFGVIGDTYARVRVSEFGSSSADGYASSGEVEDYQVMLEAPVPTLDLNTQSLQEASGVITATLSAGMVLDTAKTYSISFSPSGSSVLDRVAAETSVTIESGQSTATFQLIGVDNNILDGDLAASVIVEEQSGGPAAAADFVVIDDDEFGLEISKDQIFVEEQGTKAVTLTLESILTSPIDIELVSSDVGEVVIAPSLVTIPSGESSAVVTLEGVADNLVDGDQTLTIAAKPAGYSQVLAIVVVRDVDTSELTLSFDRPSINENGGTATGTVTLSTPYFQDLVVSLSSSDAGEATVPATAVVPAGETTVEFTVSGVDELIDDADAIVAIAASSLLDSNSANIEVENDDVAELSFSLSEETLDEGGNAISGALALSYPLDTDLVVSLAADLTSQLSFPSQVLIPAGTTTKSFAVSPIDNIIDQNDRLVTITASSARGSASDALTVIDDDTAEIGFVIETPSMSENGGSAIGTITLSTPFFQDVVVSLSSSDESEAVVPASIRINAGDVEGSFSILAVDDSILDPTQTVTIGGTSSLGDVVAFIDVTNDEVNHPPTGTPVIQGLVEVGQVLTADTSGIQDVDGLGDFNYQWFSDDAVVSGATEATYQLVGVDEDSRISVAVSYTDAQGTFEGPLTSTATDPVLPAPTWIELAFEDFERGFGIFTDGGVDARIHSGTRSYQGAQSANLQDNSGVDSSITLTDGLDLATPEYSMLRVNFWFYVNSFESNEDFWLQYNDGTTWETIGVWRRGIDFENGQFYFATVDVTDEDVALTDNSRIRFQSDASGNGDDVYIDSVSIQGFGRPAPNEAPNSSDDSVATHQNVPLSIKVLKNDSDPNGDVLTVDSFSQAENGSVSANDDGTLVYTPANDFLGSDSFTYTIGDGRGGTSTSTVIVEVVDPSQFVDLAFEDFENGFGTYTDGGVDAYIASGSTFAHQGNQALALQDNSRVQSSAELTDTLDLVTPRFTELKIEFWFKAISFETDEDFWLQYYDGTRWQTIRTWTRGVDFGNGVFNFASVVVTSDDVVFSEDAKIRLMADASGNRDDVYIDEIRISAR